MATAVRLEVTIDSSGAVTGVKQLGDALNKIPPVPKAVPDSFNLTRQQIEQAHLSGQAFTQLTGIVLPRGIENFISKSKSIAPALSGAFGLVLGGTIGLAFVDMGKKAVDAVISITDEMAGFSDKLKQMQKDTIAASQEAFFNPKNL